MRIIGLIYVGYSWEGIWERNFAWKTLAGKPIILYMIERLKRSKYIDEIILYVQDNPLNKKAIDLAKKYGLNITLIGENRGTHDQLIEFRRRIGDHDIEISIPIIPLIDPEIIDSMIEQFISLKLDYMETEGQALKGLDLRIYTNRFEEAAKLDKDKEWLLGRVSFKDFLNKYPAVFKTGMFKIEGIYKDPNFPVQVNSDSQFRLFKKIYDYFYKEGEIVNSKDVISLYQQNPKWFLEIPYFFVCEQLEIEVTNNCNLKCVMCPRTEKMTRKIDYMNFDLFKKIIDETEALSIHFSGFGEPLLHPQIKEMFTYAKDKRLEVGLWTNGINLNENLSRDVIEKELLDYIIFSLDAATREAYFKIKGVDVFDEVRENILKFLEMKSNILKDKPKYYMSGNPLVGVQILKMKENDKEIEQFMEEWDYVGRAKKMINYQTRIQRNEAVGAEVWKMLYEKFPPVEHAIIGHFNNYCGLIEDRSVVDVTPLKRFSCKQLQDGISILWDGKVVLCRQDFNGRYSLGNLKDQNMEEILEGERLKDIWQAYKDGEYNKLPPCKDCKEWYYNLYE